PGEGVGEVLERGGGRGDPPAPGGIPLRGWPPGPAPQGEALRTLPQLQNQEDWGGSVGRQNHEPRLTPPRRGIRPGRRDWSGDAPGREPECQPPADARGTDRYEPSHAPGGTG